MGDLGIQHFKNHYILNFLPRSLVPDPLDAASPVKRRIFPGCSTSSRRGCKAWKALKKPPNDPGFSTGMVRLETLWWVGGWMGGWVDGWMDGHTQPPTHIYIHIHNKAFVHILKING
jgi:hypothetical protein